MVATKVSLFMIPTTLHPVFPRSPLVDALARHASELDHALEQMQAQAQAGSALLEPLHHRALEVRLLVSRLVGPCWQMQAQAQYTLR